MNKVGIDIGGTKIECCILDENNEIIYRERTPTGTVYNELIELYNQALRDTQTREHTLGICMPGKISSVSGLMINSNIQFLNNTDFLTELKKRVKVSFKYANDSQCFALAEATLGAGSNYKNVFGIILGTGVGGALVINKQLYQGANNIASEWGHVNLDISNDIRCRCGRIGCTETWLSGPGIEQWGQKLYNKNMSVQELLSKPASSLIFLSKFGNAVANLIQIIDPDCIVLGGGISNNQQLYTRGVKEIERNIFNDELKTKIFKAELGDSAGVVGAAMLWQTI